MPNCFSLTRKSDLQAGPVSLAKIDEEMCKHFNVPVDPIKYHAYWYNIIGFKLAMGKSFDQIKDDFRMQLEEVRGDDEYRKNQKHLIEITHWLHDNFTQDAWVEIGKR